MKLKALDQIHVSAVKPDALRPGEEFEVSDALGAELLKAHPRVFAPLGNVKARRPPLNKAEPAAPANKVTKAQQNR